VRRTNASLPKAVELVQAALVWDLPVTVDVNMARSGSPTYTVETGEQVERPPKAAKTAESGVQQAEAG
jgi:hypothetical protein